MLLRLSTDIGPKDLTRDVRGFFNSLLRYLPIFSHEIPIDSLDSRCRGDVFFFFLHQNLLH